MKTSKGINFLRFIALVCLVDLVLLYLQYTKSFSSGDVNMVYRRIDTPARFILNGFLGALFNFKFAGILNWLVIPAGFYLGFRKNFFNTPAKKSVLFAFVLVSLLIGVKGFFNFRYQLTLYPISSLFLVYAAGRKNEIFSGYGQTRLPYYLLVVLLLMNNICYLTILNHREPAPANEPPKEGVIEKIISKQKEYIQVAKVDDRLRKEDSHSLKYYINMLNYIDSAGKKFSPSLSLIQLISTLPKDKKILVNNLPLIFYQAKINGIYYWCGDDMYYTQNGTHGIFAGRTEWQVQRLITDSLGCRYVYSSPSYNAYNPKFENWLFHYAKPIGIDQDEFVLYEIQETRGEYPIDAMIKARKEIKNIIYRSYLINDSLRVIKSD